MSDKICIIGCGNIGRAIASGLIKSNNYFPSQIILTRRQTKYLNDFKKQGFTILSNNKLGIKGAKIIIIAVEPQHIMEILNEIKENVTDNQIIISVVSGVTIKNISKKINNKMIVRAMPNTAIEIQQSMTCLASDNKIALNEAEKIFYNVGKTLIINEEQMISATALGACGIAFFLRAIRSASQGGIEIGFDSDTAYTIAAQTAKGASSLLLKSKNHPELEIDRVTTPRGCTIAGLNEMEHKGFSSAKIKGIVTSSKKAQQLLNLKED